MKNGWWGTIPSPENFESTGPRWSEIPDFEQIFYRNASAVTPSEKSSINTNRKSTTRFPMSLRWYRTLSLSSSKGNGRVRCKIALRLKKVCYEISLCENCQRQSCKAFIGLTICAKMIGHVRNFGSNWPRWSEIADFRSIFARRASAVTLNEKINQH